ncbi:MAG: NADH-quinone oxidoreductase subunit A, partial [Caldilineae bacterium]
WAVQLNKLKLFGLIEMAVFLLILLIGYYYVWRKGAFEWE